MHGSNNQVFDLTHNRTFEVSNMFYDSYFLMCGSGVIKRSQAIRF